MSSLDPAPLGKLADTWGERVSSEAVLHPASEVYCGRSFQEARVAAEKLDAKLLIVSAGLGLVDASTHIPAYGCTVLLGAEDGIQSRVSGYFSVASWWQALSSVSRFSVSLAKVVEEHQGPLLLALSEGYLEMLTPELIELEPTDLSRVRIFTGSQAARIPAALQSFRMPYDDRLDGPDSPRPGTRNDFASRALAHFVELERCRAPQASVEDDADAVRSAMESWRAAPKFDRIRHDDETMLLLIARYWDEVGGSSSRLLRYFRDVLDIACEQSRFAALARQVRETQA